MLERGSFFISRISFLPAESFISRGYGDLAVGFLGFYFIGNKNVVLEILKIY